MRTCSKTSGSRHKTNTPLSTLSDTSTVPDTPSSNSSSRRYPGKTLTLEILFMSLFPPHLDMVSGMKLTRKHSYDGRLTLCSAGVLAIDEDWGSMDWGSLTSWTGGQVLPCNITQVGCSICLSLRLTVG